MATIRISNFSRYKDTKVYTDERDGLAVFAPMEGPREFTTPGAITTTVIHTVSAPEIGFLDMLAVRYYGPGYERLWWAIAHKNAMIDPEREMYAGQRIVIPSRAEINNFLTRAGDVVGAAS
jgi:hypothetical protein